MTYWFLKDASTGRYLQAQWNRRTNEFDLWLDDQRAWASAFPTQDAATRWRDQILQAQDAAAAADCEPIAETVTA